MKKILEYFKISQPTPFPLVGIDEDEKLRFMVAGIHVDNALNKRRTEAQDFEEITSTNRENGKAAITAFSVAHNPWWRRLCWIAIFIQLGLAIGEKVSLREPLSDVHYVRQLAVLELGCLFIYLVDILLRTIAVGTKNFLKNPWNSIKVGVLAIMGVDVLVCLIYPNTIRVSRILRSYILIEKSRAVRTVVLNIIRTIVPTTPIFALLGFLICTYGLLGTVLFKNVEDPSFSNLLESTVSIFILVTTENFPDVMLPEYRVNKFYALFFISFLLISQVFLMNLIIAVFYEHFSEVTEKTLKRDLQLRQDSLSKAFEVIKNEENVVTLENFEKLMACVNLKDSSAEKIQFIYHMLDLDHDESLDLREFSHICQVIQLHIEEVATLDDGYWSYFPRAHFALRQVVESKYWTFARDALIIGTTIMLTIEVAVCNGRCAPVEITEDVITCVLFVEVWLRAVGGNFARFFKNRWNQLDVVLISVCFVVDVLIHRIFGIVRFGYVFIIRILLILRIMAYWKRLRVITSTAITLVPVLACFAVIIVAVFYAYAILGMELYWNRISSDNPVLQPVRYYLINFDSIGQAFVALYTLMTVNNWNTQMEGTVFATTKWSRLFYMSFYLISVVIVFNVIIAFIIETFVEQHKLRSEFENSTKFSGSILDEEMRGRIESAADRNVGNSAMKRKIWKVNQRADPNIIIEGVFKNALGSFGIQQASPTNPSINSDP